VLISRLLAAALLASLTAGLAGCSSPTQPTPPAGPSLTCPLPLSATSPDGNAVAVTYQQPPAIGGTLPVVVTCTPAPGSAFPVGSTTVACEAVDAGSRRASCSFAITVQPPPRLARTRFLAFGDSLTEGKPAMLRLLKVFPGAYTLELEAMLQERYTAQADVSVNNQAVGGEPATTGVIRLPGVLAQHRPEVVLLMDGANDINHSNGDVYVPLAADAIREMVRLSQESGAVVFLATLPPQRAGEQRARGAPFVPVLNEYIRLVARQSGATLVDVYEAFNGQASIELVDWDGLHLTKAGYRLVAETFYEKIRETLEER
jgi:lysophospholipase L1-like esterase